MIEISANLDPARAESARPSVFFLIHAGSRNIDILTKSYCIYHFPVDLEQQTDSVRSVPNQSENGKYNMISV